METQYVLDNLWVMIAAVLVFLMQAGFALLEAGMTRAKNVANIMAKNLADASIGILAFFFVGYMFAYGGSGTLIGFDLDYVGLRGLELFGLSEGLSESTSFFFQAVFAATAVTIASGAMAERTKIKAYLLFSLLMTAVIYPIVVHWTWGGGLIAKINIGDAVYSDFAGSGVVHLTGGIAALVGAWMLGPRLGKYCPEGTSSRIPGHSIPMATLGVFILWFGWFGFNAGSELAADDWVMFVALNTVLAAAAGGMAATAVHWPSTGHLDVGMAGNGVLGGLVGITAGCGTVTPIGAVIIGAVAGVLVPLATEFVDRRLKIDDAVGAFSVHGIGGIWGVLSIGLFAKYDDAFLGRDDAGLFYGGGLDQLMVQILMVVIIAAFVSAASFLAFKLLSKTVGLRVSPEEEVTGLDVAEHGGAGYGADPHPSLI